MKKGFKRFLMAFVVLGAIFTLAACGNEEAATLESSHTYSDTVPFEYQGTVLGDTHSVYLVNLYSDGTYKVVNTSVSIIGGANGGSTVWEYYGTYEKGEAVDGFIPLTLNDPTRAIYTSYSTMGGYAFNYDSANVEDFSTVELGGGIMVETEKGFFSYVPTKDFEIVTNALNEETSQLAISSDE
ncbi:MAG: hypothetical protein UMR38_03120 [Candidatus Izemoplasma sp.]|nr:hypothetical protein [Candidatus Izemoplasma sp.]